MMYFGIVGRVLERRVIGESDGQVSVKGRGSGVTYDVDINE